MTEPQIWTLIGVFAAAMFGTMGLMSTMFVRVIRAEIGGVRSEIGGLRAEMNARFEAMDTKFTAKFEALDRNIQVLMRHTFPDGP